MSAAPARLSTADRALLRAHSAWGQAGAERFWRRFEVDWSARLRSGSDAESAGEANAEAVRANLQTEHAAEARPDLARVHPSWWVRGLQDETAAVQCAVASHARDEVAEVVRTDLKLTTNDLATSRPPYPEAVRWALALWTERLVGGLAVMPGDPPVITALTALGRSTLFRLVAVTGLAKLAYALAGSERSSADAARQALRSRDRDRVARFTARFEPFDPRLVNLARLDLASAKVAGRQKFERLGMTTIGRLLADAEPHRVRWALQHLPYNLAKFTRARINLTNSQVAAARLVAWEERVFHEACDRVRAEGRLADPGVETS